MASEVITLAVWDDISTYVEATREGLHAEAARIEVESWDEAWRDSIRELAERVIG